MADIIPYILSDGFGLTPEENFGPFASAGWGDVTDSISPGFSGDDITSILNYDNDGIKTAIIVSLFSDKRIPLKEEEPPRKNDRRGFWADPTFNDDMFTGSLLWTLKSANLKSPEIIESAEEIASEALNWLVADGVAESIDINVSEMDGYCLTFEVIIRKPETFEIERYFFTWNQLLSGE